MTPSGFGGVGEVDRPGRDDLSPVQTPPCDRRKRSRVPPREQQSRLGAAEFGERSAHGDSVGDCLEESDVVRIELECREKARIGDAAVEDSVSHVVEAPVRSW
jgi:hypothetical protein